MSIDNSKNPSDIRFGAIVCTSRCEYNSNPYRWKHYAEHRIREEMAHYIMEEKSEMEIEKERVEMRLDLYVATPDVFWKIVNKEAEKLAMRFMNR